MFAFSIELVEYFWRYQKKISSCFPSYGNEKTGGEIRLTCSCFTSLSFLWDSPASSLQGGPTYKTWDGILRQHKQVLGILEEQLALYFVKLTLPNNRLKQVCSKNYGEYFQLPCSEEKIRKFQFDKKETCVSKLLMKFTHTHKFWFGEEKIRTI